MTVGKLITLLTLAGIASARPRVAHGTASGNWCGQVLLGNDFQSVEASWTVPIVHEPPPPQQDSTGYYFSSQWVGIDGSGDCGAILQAGTEMNVSSSDPRAYYIATMIRFAYNVDQV